MVAQLNYSPARTDHEVADGAALSLSASGSATTHNYPVIVWVILTFEGCFEFDKNCRLPQEKICKRTCCVETHSVVLCLKLLPEILEYSKYDHFLKVTN